MSTLLVENIRHEDATSPAITLDVNGNVTIGSDTTFNYAGNNGLQIQSDAGNNAGVFLETNGGTIKSIFTADTNANYSNIGTLTNHPLRLITNDAVRLMVLANGNVGIGTSSPNQKLSVAGNIEIYNDNTDGHIWFHDAGDASWSIGMDNSDQRMFKIVPGVDLTSAGSVNIKNNAVVGIGTALIPDAASLALAQDLKLVTPTNTKSRVFSRTDGTGAYTLGTSGGAAIVLERLSDNSDEIAFETHFAGNSHAERMRVTKDGDVKIINPAASPVNGVNLPGALIFEGNGWNTAEGSRTVQGQIHLWGGYNNPTGGSVEPALVFSLKGTGNGSYNTADGPDVLTERMRLDNYGKLGIGVSSPQNPLHVSGTVEQNATGYIDLTASYATVFDLDDHASSWASGVNIYVTGRENGVPGANKSFATYTAVKSNSGWALSGPFNVVKVGNDHGYPEVQVTSDGQLQLRNRLGSNLGDAWVSLHIVCG